jgi:hypothetical protein
MKASICQINIYTFRGKTMTIQNTLGSTGIYVWTDLISEVNGTTTLTHSGFSIIIPWSLHVRDNGDLVWNDTPLIQSGVYVGPSSLATALSALKDAGLTIIMSVGAAVWGDLNYDFTNLLKYLGTYNGKPVKTENLMYKNFSALQKALPYLDGFDFDNEDCWGIDGTNAMVSFGHLLYQLGYKVITFCPYSDFRMWLTAYNQLEGISSGLVQRWNLQCYAGGVSNTPQQWINQLEQNGISSDAAKSLVSPGLAVNLNVPDNCNAYQSPRNIAKRFSQPGWKGCGISSAWIWRYDDIVWDESNCNGAAVGQYQKALIAGLAEASS